MEINCSLGQIVVIIETSLSGSCFLRHLRVVQSLAGMICQMCWIVYAHPERTRGIAGS